MKTALNQKMQQRIDEALSEFVVREKLDDTLAARIKGELFADLVLPNLADENPDCEISFSLDQKCREISCQIGPRNWDWNISYMTMLLGGRLKVKLQDQPELKGATHIVEDLWGRFYEGTLSDHWMAKDLFKDRQRITKKNAMRLIRGGKRVYVCDWAEIISEINSGAYDAYPTQTFIGQLVQDSTGAQNERPHERRLNEFEQLLDAELDLKFAEWLQAQKRRRAA